MSWRFGSLWREALANLRSNAIRSAVLGVVTAAMLGGLAFLELRDTAELRAFSERFRQSGGYVAIATAEGGISASRCAALDGRDGIIAAGAVRSRGQVTFATAPGVLFQSVELTPGTLRAWAPRSDVPLAETAGALLVGPALASELGVREGFVIHTEDGVAATIASVLDTGTRNPQSARWAIEVVPPGGTANDCWVEFEPGAYTGGLEMLAAYFTTGDREAAVRPYTRQDEFSRNPQEELERRPQKSGWPLASVLIAGVAWLGAWFRRAELGLYLALGTPRRLVFALQAFESWAITAVALVAGTLWAAAIHGWIETDVHFDSLRLAGWTPLQAALLAGILAPIGAAIMARGSVASLLKDR